MKKKDTLKKALLVGMLSLGTPIPWAGSVWAQSSGGPAVTLNMKSATVKQFFTEVKKQTGLNFMISSELAQRLSKVDVHVKGKPVYDVLHQVLGNNDCTFKVEGNIVTVTQRQQKSSKKELRHLRGRVLDSEGEPIIGAVIKIKGTKQGSVTDINGMYDFTVLAKPITLTFSYVGFAEQEVSFEGSSDVVRNVELKSNTDIDEVVVTGYNIIDRRQLTSSITSLKAEDIMRPGIQNIDQMLEGQVPDMIFMNNSGEVGTVPKLRIRGTSTLIGNREPLWVLDGVVLQDPVNVSPEELNNPDYVNRIGNAIAGINPQDIERIDVLKDASATALYGAKAANGVIVVTTKKGHVGKPVISYNMNVTLRKRPYYSDSKIDLMNSRERVDFSRYLIQNGYNFGNNPNLAGYENLAQQYYSGVISHDEFARQAQALEATNTDWFDLLTHNSLSTQHSVSISGGSDNARYYGSVGYSRDNDVIRGNYSQRYSYSVHLDANLSHIFSTSFGVTGNINKRDYNQPSLAPLDYAYNTSRAIPAYVDGDYYFYKVAYANEYYNYNILNELDNSYNRQEGNATNFNFTINGKFTDYLKASLIASYQFSNTNQDQWWGENSEHVAELRRSEVGVAAQKGDDSQSLLPFGGELTQNNYRNNNWMVRFQIDFNKYLDENQVHNITASVGFEANSTRYKATNAIYRGYYEDRGKQFSATMLDDYPYYKNWVQNNYPTLTDNLTNLLSGYATVSYSYKNLFTLNANTRMDGSNKFGDRSNEKLLPIWSVSGNYNLSEHNFFRRDWIDFIMLKASYGYQGNMLDGQSPQLIIKQLPTDPTYNELVSKVSVYPNPNLRWEKTTSWNAGLSFSVFDRRLQFEGEFYYKKTHDAFLTREISSVNGQSSYVVNSGNITNKGYNLSITAEPVRFKDFSWRVSTSFSKVFNELQTLPGQDQYELSDYLNGTALIKGQPVGTFYSYKFVGLNPKDGSPLFDDKEEMQDELVNMTKYQLYTTVLTKSGRREPTMSGTFNNTIRYKQWRINAVFNYALGSKVRLLKMFNSTIFSPSQNINRELLNGWRKPGDELNTNIPSPLSYTTHWSVRSQQLPAIASNTWDEYNYSDIRVVSGDYLKLSTLSLTYEFKPAIIQHLGLDRLALNLTGNNLFTICSSKLKGQTPQQSGFSEVQLSDTPSYTLGLELSF